MALPTTASAPSAPAACHSPITSAGSCGFTLVKVISATFGCY